MTEGPSQRMHRQAKAGIEEGLAQVMEEGPFTKALRQAGEQIKQGFEQGLAEAQARRERRARLEAGARENMLLIQEREIVELASGWSLDRPQLAEAMKMWLELWEEHQERQPTQDADAE